MRIERLAVALMRSGRLGTGPAGHRSSGERGIGSSHGPASGGKDRNLDLRRHRGKAEVVEQPERRDLHAVRFRTVGAVPSRRPGVCHTVCAVRDPNPRTGRPASSAGVKAARGSAVGACTGARAGARARRFHRPLGSWCHEGPVGQRRHGTNDATPALVERRRRRSHSVGLGEAALFAEGAPRLLRRGSLVAPAILSPVSVLS